jgi:hypothetical protein
MSLSDPDLEEVGRRLDEAFSGIRPRPGFADQLWARIHQVPPVKRRMPWPVAAAVVACLLVAFLAVAVPRLASPGRQSTSLGTTALPSSAKEAPAARSAQTRRPLPGEAFGLLPPPPAVPAGGQAGTSPVAYDGPAQLTVSAPLPTVPATLLVYRYASGFAPGAIVSARQLLAAGASSSYPSLSPAQAARAAVTAAPASPSGFTPPPRIALTSVQLVYVAVPIQQGGYLEPAYLFTGDFRNGTTTYEKRVLIPALQPSAYR